MFADTIGLVLAGGRSSRMGVNKALLKLNGRTLLDEAYTKLRALGLNEVYVSGDYPDYPSIVDTDPFSGPAKAIVSCAKTLPQTNGRVLIVPVDMPLLTQSVLSALCVNENTSGGQYFEEYYLPCCLVLSKLKPLDLKSSQDLSVRSLLKKVGATSLSMGDFDSRQFANLNTRSELDAVKAMQTSCA